MRLIPRLRTRFLASEHGFSMIVVMGVMAASALFVAAAFAATDGDLTLTRNSQDRKQAYGAAEAGINLYQYHLNQDPDYWTRCTNVPPPNSTENQPVNQAWNGAGADPRRWRNVAGGQPRYTIELLPANKAPACVEGNQATMIDATTGSFRIRATGQPHAGSTLKRSIIATFRRRSFLDYLYFTDFETTDPVNYASGNQAWAQENCGDLYRAARSRSCQEIQFADFDQIKGPFHTNDDILTCGTPEFGRGSADPIEFSGPDPGYREVGGGGCSGSPVFKGPRTAGAKALTMPSTNASLQTVAATGGVVYTGTTTIRFNGSPASNMTVTNNGVTTTRALPANGVLYVQSGAGGCGTPPPPSEATYSEPASCGNLYVSGTYTGNMTLAAANDIIIRPPAGSSNGDLIGNGSAVLGLIATNFVRVYHPVSGCRDVAPVMNKVRIDAAILSLAHSFTVDNHDCGSQQDELTIKGGIAQKYRGVVGTTGGTGFKKDYNYDDRLRFRSPPYFLEPIAASWHVVRSNEQLPAR